MDITQLLKEAVASVGSKKRAAELMGITRPTLDTWLGGLYVPDPWDHSRRISEFLMSQGIDADQPTVAVLLLEEKGVDTAFLRAIGERAATVSNRAKPGYQRRGAPVTDIRNRKVRPGWVDSPGRENASSVDTSSRWAS